MKPLPALGVGVAAALALGFWIGRHFPIEREPQARTFGNITRLARSAAVAETQPAGAAKLPVEEIIARLRSSDRPPALQPTEEWETMFLSLSADELARVAGGIAYLPLHQRESALDALIRAW